MTLVPLGTMEWRKIFGCTIFRAVGKRGLDFLSLTALIRSAGGKVGWEVWGAKVGDLI